MTRSLVNRVGMLAVVVAAVGGGLAPVDAWAQATTPARAGAMYYAVVATDKLPLLCHNTETSYAVGELKAGMVLSVFEEKGTFASVGYPGGMTAFIRADEVVVEGGSVKLIKPSVLRAASLSGGFSRSWKALFPAEAPLAEGTTLKLVDGQSAEQENGVTVAYRVVAPGGSRGWVDAKGLRRATDEEIKNANLAPVAISTPTSEPKPETQPERQPERKTADAPAGMTPIGQPGTTLAEPQNPGTEGVRTTVRPANAGATGGGATPAAPVQRPAERRVGSVEELEAIFNDVRQKPMSADIDELMAEYERAGQQATAGSTRQRQIEQRLEVLRTMKEYRETVRRREEERRLIDAGEIKLREEIARFESTRVYTMVGVLAPSTVYDGKRLPLMYRVQSVGGVSPRTLGYIRPNPEMRLEEKLGTVVGVIGDSQLDQALKLNVINAVRVDTLRAGSDGTLSAPTPTPGAASPAPANPAPTNPAPANPAPTATPPAAEKPGMVPVPPMPGTPGRATPEK